ncbi:hypothetical protein A359_00340 [secondary endosymbiont of Ctenarytaina eucalypti]|uniref:Uncharacterized protein n=1 Tax=secondary endosymbiont of Ctenarytaina eucalypti TaxID=1199245 RepID=J3VR76_9ENTR|nr:hypothetical protein A359_00340 [secondary endosymbiont of Ctenarytaina eucalypti]
MVLADGAYVKVTVIILCGEIGQGPLSSYGAG